MISSMGEKLLLVQANRDCYAARRCCCWCCCSCCRATWAATAATRRSASSARLTARLCDCDAGGGQQLQDDDDGSRVSDWVAFGRSATRRSVRHAGRNNHRRSAGLERVENARGGCSHAHVRRRYRCTAQSRRPTHLRSRIRRCSHVLVAVRQTILGDGLGWLHTKGTPTAPCGSLPAQASTDWDVRPAQDARW